LVGNKKHIHKLAVDGTEIDDVVGPPDMRAKDVTELFNAATDITSIPGMLGSNLSLEETSDGVRNTPKWRLLSLPLLWAEHPGSTILFGNPQNGMG
jgi:hypothetical protein